MQKETTSRVSKIPYNFPKIIFVFVDEEKNRKENVFRELKINFSLRHSCEIII